MDTITYTPRKFNLGSTCFECDICGALIWDYLNDLDNDDANLYEEETGIDKHNRFHNSEQIAKILI